MLGKAFLLLSEVLVGNFVLLVIKVKVIYCISIKEINYFFRTLH